MLHDGDKKYNWVFMTRLTLEQILILNLQERIPEGSMAYTKKEDAYLALKKYTGQDFGNDIEKWKSWVEENGLSILDSLKNESSKHKIF